MDLEKKYVCWGGRLVAAVAALAGAVALARPFRAAPLAGGAAAAPRRRGVGRRPAAKRASAKR